MLKSNLEKADSEISELDDLVDRVVCVSVCVRVCVCVCLCMHVHVSVLAVHSLKSFPSFFVPHTACTQVMKENYSTIKLCPPLLKVLQDLAGSATQ